MTQDFVEDAIEACNREKVPFVFAMQTGDEGEWQVNYNLSHHHTLRKSKEEEVCELISRSMLDVQADP